jgi:urate oxidase
MATSCEVTWTYEETPPDFSSAYEAIRDTLIKTFAFHKSLSVQHTLYAMGKNVLEEYGNIKEINLVMPNKHHILFNLEQFGMDNNNEVFIATDEPFGYISGTVSRDL